MSDGGARRGYIDQSLAGSVAVAEARLSSDSPTAIVEQVRVALIAALQARRHS